MIIGNVVLWKVNQWRLMTQSFRYVLFSENIQSSHVKTFQEKLYFEFLGISRWTGNDAYFCLFTIKYWLVVLAFNPKTAGWGSI